MVGGELRPWRLVLDRIFGLWWGMPGQNHDLWIWIRHIEYNCDDRRISSDSFANLWVEWYESICVSRRHDWVNESSRRAGLGRRNCYNSLWDDDPRQRISIPGFGACPAFEWRAESGRL